MQLHPAVAFTAARLGRPARPPGSAARLGGLVGALLALPAVAVLQTTISSYLRGHVIVDAD
jgi:hypothetical protein